MIHFDSSFLIACLLPGSQAATVLRRWVADGEAFNISVVAEAEFLCGPTTAAQRIQVGLLCPKPEPLLSVDAARAAELFNQTGRRRGTLPDCMIAAVAIRHGAQVATLNFTDFQRFAPFGAVLAGPT